jgi:hypothetical protein
MTMANRCRSIWWLSVMPRNKQLLAARPSSIRGGRPQPQIPSRVPHGRALLVGLLASFALLRVASADDATPDASDATPSAAASAQPAPFEIAYLQGRVVWYGEALERRLGVKTVPEAAQRVLALETRDGRLIPLIEDLRTRAFRQDERLRQMDLELRVRRYQATPAVQVLTVYELRDGVKYEVDYWCDICAIPMYETGPCACCQQENRLRKRKVDDAP